jgi:hypothetical protein
LAILGYFFIASGPDILFSLFNSWSNGVNIPVT